MKDKIELVFEKYRKHKYFTLFMVDYNTNITSYIDEIGGGRSNQTSDQTANTAIEIADKKEHAKNFVEMIELAVDQLPEIEKRIIELRYMCRDYNYISDYTIYDVKVPMSDKTYRKIRSRAFKQLGSLLNL